SSSPSSIGGGNTFPASICQGDMASRRSLPGKRAGASLLAWSIHAGCCGGLRKREHLETRRLVTDPDLSRCPVLRRCSEDCVAKLFFASEHARLIQDQG